MTVAAVEGSVPREAGAKMLVTGSHIHDTIGGGHLEFSAIALARAMLAHTGGPISQQRQLARLALGPTLGQCCGGVVHLAFERLVTNTALSTLLHARWQQGQDSWRLTALDAATAPVLYDGDGTVLAGVAPDALTPDFDRAHSCRLLRDTAGQRWLLDACLPYRTHLYLFGAGHVGAAIVRVLADVPCHITWIDSRADQFSASPGANVTIDVNDEPETAVAHAPAQASFLVMTHSHPLDQRLAEAILRRTDVGWFGLIGSRTKRIQFERRLRARGFEDSCIDTMTCPVGIAGIDGKAPATIAIAVAAQLLQVWERQQQLLAIRGPDTAPTFPILKSDCQ